MFKRIRIILALGCRDASRLLSDRSERPLALHERVALRTHLLICGGCRRYRRYLLALRSAVRGDQTSESDADTPSSLAVSVDRDDRLSTEAKERLKGLIERA